MHPAKTRVVFMGTPQFAVPCLEALAAASDIDVVGVITAPDRPAGRGHQPQPPAVKTAAERLGLNILQPEKLRDPVFMAALEALRPDVQVVVAFRMLPQAVWALPRWGTFNLHGSLLPDYRGAAPIQWAVINGETETGLTTFLLDKEIDTGGILFTHREPIYPTDDAGTLHDRLMAHGPGLVLQTVRALATRTATPQPQDETQARHPAPKLFPEHGLVDWGQPATAIRNRIRGLTPHPGAYTFLDGKRLKLFPPLDAHPDTSAPGLPGAFRLLPGGRLEVSTGQGTLLLSDVQLEGKKRMPAPALLNGLRITEGVFGNVVA